MTPSVSICIPTYNGEAFLAQTIKSALSQTAEDIEVIVVDDCSTDDTVAVVNQFNDDRLRFVRFSTNQGVTRAWNGAVELSRAPLVKLLCHDDLLEDRCIERQRDVMRDTSIAITSCWRHVINTDGNRVLLRKGMKTTGRLANRLEVTRAVVREGTNVIGEPSATMFRRADWLAEGGFDGGDLYVIDVQMWLRLLRHGRLAVIEEPLCSFRVSRSALSTRLARTQAISVRRFFASLAADSANQISRADMWRGSAMASMRNVARRMLYWKWGWS